MTNAAIQYNKIARNSYCG